MAKWKEGDPRPTGGRYGQPLIFTYLHVQRMERNLPAAVIALAYFEAEVSRSLEAMRHLDEVEGSVDVLALQEALVLGISFAAADGVATIEELFMILGAFKNRLDFLHGFDANSLADVVPPLFEKYRGFKYEPSAVLHNFLLWDAQDGGDRAATYAHAAVAAAKAICRVDDDTNDIEIEDLRRFVEMLTHCGAVKDLHAIAYASVPVEFEQAFMETYVSSDDGDDGDDGDDDDRAEEDEGGDSGYEPSRIEDELGEGFVASVSADAAHLEMLGAARPDVVEFAERARSASINLTRSVEAVERLGQFAVAVAAGRGLTSELKSAHTSGEATATLTIATRSLRFVQRCGDPSCVTISFLVGDVETAAATFDPAALDESMIRAMLEVSGTIASP